MPLIRNPPFDLGGHRARRRQVRAGIRLAHPDAETQFARSDARYDPAFLIIGALGKYERTALPICDPVRNHRGTGGQQLFGHDIALQRIARVAAVFLGKGHADPTALCELS